MSQPSQWKPETDAAHKRLCFLTDSGTPDAQAAEAIRLAILGHDLNECDERRCFEWLADQLETSA